MWLVVKAQGSEAQEVRNLIAVDLKIHVCEIHGREDDSFSVRRTPDECRKFTFFLGPSGLQGSLSGWQSEHFYVQQAHV